MYLHPIFVFLPHICICEGSAHSDLTDKQEYKKPCLINHTIILVTPSVVIFFTTLDSDFY